jgi:hypothetical protein
MVSWFFAPVQAALGTLGPGLVEDEIHSGILEDSTVTSTDMYSKDK